MGNSAAIQGNGGERVKQTGWNASKMNKVGLAFNAICRMTNQANELYSLQRHEREPWKTLLAHCAEEFDEERRMQAEEEMTEHTPEFLAMMMGIIPAKNVKRHASEVWIFVSSTFTDTRLERDLLMEDVYPYIRDYCREIGLTFNVVDFRWGIRNTACNQHLSAQICMREVQRCKENSVGPFFVGILGQKYGWRPIPYTIPVEIYLGLLDYIKKQAEEDPEMKEAAQLLEQWFKIDFNAIDHIAVLQPINSIYTKFAENCPIDTGKWKQTFSVMQNALFTAIRRSKLSRKEINELTWSVTEGEIREGTKDMDDDETDRVFMFNRNLSSFDESLKSAKYFIDQTPDGEVDGDSQIKLGDLRNHLRKIMPEQASHRYKLGFKDSNKEMLQDESNKEQLRKFLDQFSQFMIDSIKEGALAQATALDHMDYAEVLSHSVFCREKAEAFVGRGEVLETVTNHLLLQNGVKPYVIHGEGGSGKSSIIAKVFSNVSERWEQVDSPGRPIMVIRFVSVTPDSSNIRNLLYSICIQLCHCLDLDADKLPMEYKPLESRFHEMLKLATKDRPIMIFLDALDQLTPENEAHDLNWLPSRLADFVHVVVSVRPGAGGVFASYKKLGNSEHSLEVVPMDEKDRTEMIQLRLKKLGRSITESQMNYVMTAYGKGQPTALYLRLACDIASSWKSYTPLDKCRLADGTMGIIEQLFIGLEEEHGMLFVSHTLGYLTAANNGLSSNELIDVLSCDEDVLEDVFQYHVPPIRRLPPLLWTRLRLALGDYLVESGADKIVVFHWYHRLFHVVAKHRYLLTMNGQRIHENLAHYFLGTWANKPKPYRMKGKRKVDIAHRRVQDQPMYLDPTKSTTDSSVNRSGGSAGKHGRLNQRKLTELATHLIAANMWAEAEQVLCSIPWCEAKVSTGRIYQLLDELSQAATKCDDTEKSNTLGCFYRMLRANSQLLIRHHSMICQQAINEPDASRCVTIGAAYLEEKGPKFQVWADLSKSQAPDPEVMTFSNPAPVTIVTFSHLCKHLAVGLDNNTVRVWRTSSGALEMTIEDVTPVKLAWPLHCFWLAILQHSSVMICGTGTGGGLAKAQVVCTIKTDPITANVKVYIPKQGKQLFLAYNNKVVIYNTSNGKQLKKYDIKCRPQSMEFTPNGKYLLIAHNNRVYMFDYTKNEEIKEFPMARVKGLHGTCLAFSPNGRSIMGVLPCGTVKWKNNGKKGQQDGLPFMLNCMNGEAVIAPDLDYIASLEGENYLKVLKLNPSAEWCRLEAHQSPITCADFGKSSKYLILATGSKDCKVRLWDATSFTPHVMAKVEKHYSSVTGCAFSSDGTKAVSSSSHDGAWLWNCTTTPPKVDLWLMPQDTCVLTKIACVSNDGEFVAGYCKENDIDIWNTRGPRESDNISMTCVHRMMPYVNPHYFFMKFKRALLACFTTSNRLGVVFLTELLPENCLNDWRTNPNRVPVFRDYNQNLSEFDHTPSYKVMDVSLRDDGDRLVTVTNKLADKSLLDTVVSHKNHIFLEGAVSVHVWNVKSRECLFKTEITEKLTKFHCAGFLNTYPVVFVQEAFKKSVDNAVKVSRGGAHRNQQSQITEQTAYTVTRILHPESGDILGKVTIEGDYDTLTLPSDKSLQSGMTIDEAMQRIMLSCLRDGVFMSTCLIKNSPMLKFVVKSSIVKAYGFSTDNQSAIVGFDTGAVRFLRLSTAKGKKFLGKS